jgi:hypothetical protein
MAISVTAPCKPISTSSGGCFCTAAVGTTAGVHANRVCALRALLLHAQRSAGARRLSQGPRMGCGRARKWPQRVQEQGSSKDPAKLLVTPPARGRHDLHNFRAPCSLLRLTMSACAKCGKVGHGKKTCGKSAEEVQRLMEERAEKRAEKRARELAQNEIIFIISGFRIPLKSKLKKQARRDARSLATWSCCKPLWRRAPCCRRASRRQPRRCWSGTGRARRRTCPLPRLGAFVRLRAPAHALRPGSAWRHRDRPLRS